MVIQEATPLLLPFNAHFVSFSDVTFSDVSKSASKFSSKAMALADIQELSKIKIIHLKSGEWVPEG